MRVEPTFILGMAFAFALLMSALAAGIIAIVSYTWERFSKSPPPIDHPDPEMQRAIDAARYGGNQDDQFDQ